MRIICCIRSTVSDKEGLTGGSEYRPGKKNPERIEKEPAKFQLIQSLEFTRVLFIFRRVFFCIFFSMGKRKCNVEFLCKKQMGDVPEQAKTIYRRMPLDLWHPAEPGRPDSRPPVREIRFFIVRKNSKSLMTETVSYDRNRSNSSTEFAE